MSKKILISIGAGPHQRGVLVAGRQLGYELLAVDINPLAESFKYADQTLVSDAHDAEKTLEAIRQVSETEQIAGVVTQASRGCISTTAKVADALGCLHLDVAAAECSLEKNDLIRKFHPELVLDRNDVVDHLSYPLLAKWDEGSGGTGIQVIRSAAEMRSLMEGAKTNPSFECHRLLTGRHFGVLGMASQSGIHYYGVLEQFLDDDLKIVETCFPATLTEATELNCLEAADKYLSGIGFDLGPFQVELIQDQEGNIYLVEIEASILGSFISEGMIPEAGKNDFIRDAILTLTEPGYIPVIHENQFQIRNQFPDTPLNQGPLHLLSKTELQEVRSIYTRVGVE